MLRLRAWSICLCTFVSILVWGGAAPSAASRGGSQTADRAKEGRISGVVERSDGLKFPIAGATVALSDGRRNVCVISNDRGAFVFGHVAPGRYDISASKEPYLPMSYGGWHSGLRGVEVALGPGGNVDNLVIRLPLGGVIAGTVRDDNSEPVSGVRVDFYVAAGMTYPLRGTLVSQAVTDDDGEYRVYGLSPGEYLIAGSYRGEGNGSITRRSANDVDSVLAMLRGGAGIDTTEVPPGKGAEATGRSGTYSYLRSFYPGVPSVSEAVPILLAEGEERDAVDFSIGPFRSGSVSGVVSAPGAQSIQSLVVRLRPAGLALPPGEFAVEPVLANPPGPDGRFRFAAVTAGRYLVTAHAKVKDGSGNASSTWWAGSTVESEGVDISGVALALRPAGRVAGRLIFESSRIRSVDLSSFTVRLTPLPGENEMSGPISARVFPDGHFEVNGIPPGRFSVSAESSALEWWWLRSVRSDGIDVTDSFVDLWRGDALGVVLSVSDNPTIVTGSLVEPDGSPAMQYSIVAFPVDESLWLLGKRWVQIVRPGTDGRYIIRGLPPGEYYVAALTDVPAANALDGQTLRQVVPLAMKVAVAESSQEILNLKVVR
jgi:Carboxypeptidase regulatory-like domain